jgi:hypothetical protein
MRAIGKRSLASILAAGLHVVRVVIFIAFFSLSIGAIVMPFVPFIAQWAGGGEHIGIDGDVGAGDYVKLMTYFVAFGVMLFIVNRLLEILKTLRVGSPFVRENAVRFRQVGYALLLGEGAKLAFGVLAMIFDADVKLGTELTTWLAMIAVFVLAEVFLEGAKMKEEQDLTV